MTLEQIDEMMRIFEELRFALEKPASDIWNKVIVLMNDVAVKSALGAGLAGLIVGKVI